MQVIRKLIHATTRVQFFALAVASFFVHSVANAQATPVKQWKGEYFSKKEGGLFVKTIATGFRGPATANIQVTLYGIIQQKYFTFSNTQVAVDATPREIWKLPSGKYQVSRIDFIDNTGTNRVWLAKQAQPIAVLVPRIMLSNLGRWSISPEGINGLAVKFEMVPNSYSEKVAPKDSSVAAVINGFTGSVQQVLGGKQVVDAADKGYSDENTIRATASFTRQIGMFYKVNLFKHNKYSKDVMGALAAFDANLRGCYTSALENNGSLAGDLVLKVLASAKTGTIRQATKSKGSIADGAMIDCILTEIQQIPMPVQENMIGELTFMFQTK